MNITTLCYSATDKIIVLADEAYDTKGNLKYLQENRIIPRIKVRSKSIFHREITK